MKTLKVGIIQQSYSSDLKENINKNEACIKKCAAEGAELIVFSELHNSLYFCQTEDIKNFELAETIPGETTNHFQKLAKELEVVIVLSLFEKRMQGIYHNTAVVIEKDGTIAGKYRKMHIPDDPGYYEKFYFTPGDLGFEPINTSVGKLGVQVCWDQWYPEGARLMSLAGADVLIYPTAIGFEPTDNDDEKKRQLDAWITIQKSHAIANGLPVISVNRVGFEEDPTKSTNGIDFWGNSFVADAQGEVIHKFSTEKEEIQVVTIDLEKSEKTRQLWPFLRDRRVDSYNDITKRAIDN